VRLLASIGAIVPSLLSIVILYGAKQNLQQDQWLARLGHVFC